MRDPVVIGDAGHKGQGVFAARDLQTGSLILHFQGRVIHHDELTALTHWEREHLGELTADTYQILPASRCYLNHSCVPNGYSTSDAVYAWRDIASGDEITIDYRLNAYDDGNVWQMVCRCEAYDVPHIVIGDCFSLPDKQQAGYLPYAPPFFQQSYRLRHGLTA